ncbi:PhnD/SsuA/transferrin family substrate-binding protein [Aquisalimonas lutea]|uniref:PhnD/SsuA/transferrin family substrate-binding protein n=1 Tax=Aquisalimonas lutea TaxID=1327750 RepID=UPI0025B5D776|nr:PhnD/SsuA/transferrin family substrate-binding protein [Aquisalimonas lutea]MDN3517670.1 PhnD/SsuA/transferrin family substrate-binding protein [Aquisalimonas lutea]
MLRHAIATTALLTGSVLLGGSGTVAASTDLAEACPNPMRMADTGIEGMGQLDEAFGPFQEAFQEHTGLELELYSLSNRTAAGNALRYDEVELVFAGPSEFVLFQQEVEEGVEILFDIKRPYYGSTFLAKADSGIESLEGIDEDTSIAMKDTGSTSGHIIPSQMLVEAGHDIDELDITMAGDAFTHALANGDVDVMAGGNDDADYVREELDPEGDYRVLAESDPLPGDPVIIRANIASECKTRLRETLRENRDDLWEALISTERNEEKFLNRGAELGFSLTAEDYQVIKEAYEAAGIDL